jgi:hypothetical protein
MGFGGQVSEFFLLRDKYLEAEEPCGHPGCLSHITHPCEGCGRTGGRYEYPKRKERGLTQYDLYRSMIRLGAVVYKTSEWVESDIVYEIPNSPNVITGEMVFDSLKVVHPDTEAAFLERCHALGVMAIPYAELIKAEREAWGINEKEWAECQRRETGLL